MLARRVPPPADRVSAMSPKSLPRNRIRNDRQLIASYVARSFDDPALYASTPRNRPNLPPADQVMLRNIPAVDGRGLGAAAGRSPPQVTVAQAGFAVHAALAWWSTSARLVQLRQLEESRANVRRMMEVTVLGQHAAAPLN